MRRLIPPYAGHISDTCVSRSMVVAVISDQAKGAAPMPESDTSLVISTFENNGYKLRQEERENIAR